MLGLSKTTFSLSSQIDTFPTQAVSFLSSLQKKVKEKYQQLSPTAKAALGITVICTVTAGLYGFAIGIKSNNSAVTISDVLDNKRFLVIHDNKPYADKAAGRLLARIGLIDESGYTPVKIPLNSPLASSADLESLVARPNSFITCQSNGKTCFEFDLIHDADQSPVANVIRTFSLKVPENEYTNIEGVAISNSRHPQIFWSHRGEPNMVANATANNPAHLTQVFSAPYSDFATEFTPVPSKTITSPFDEERIEFRSRADHVITSEGRHLFVAATDPEETGAKDIGVYSIVHNENQESIYRLEGDKIEAMYHDGNTDTLYLASDNEGAGARICKIALNALHTLGHKCVSVLKGQEYGISGMVELQANGRS